MAESQAGSGSQTGSGSKAGEPQALDPKLMEILVCPESKAKLIRQGDWLVSTDRSTRRRYPIREGIPIMLIDESEVVSEEEHQQIMEKAQKENA